MSPLRFFIAVIWLFAGINSVSAQPQVDSAYIRGFNRQNSFEVYTGLYSTEFKFTKKYDASQNFKLRVNSSSYLGIDLSYKWLYLQYSFNLPGTQLDSRNNFKYQLVRFQFGNRKINIQPFYNYYNGLLIPETGHRRFKPFQGIALSNAGFDLFYYTNCRKFSSSSANIFSEQQLQSAGALFFCITPLWQKIYWRKHTRGLIHDSTTYTLLSSNPEWISLLPGVGYTYNLVPGKDGWLVAPAVLAKIGGLKEIHPVKRSIQFLSDLQFWMNVGYSHERYYVYLNASFERLNTNLLIKDMNRTDMNISLTGGIRFRSLKKKILGLL